MLDHETENFRELCLYFISTRQWKEAYELHQQTYGSSPSDAQNAIREIAVRYGHSFQEETSPFAIVATCSLMTCVVAFVLLHLVR